MQMGLGVGVVKWMAPHWQEASIVWFGFSGVALMGFWGNVPFGGWLDMSVSLVYHYSILM